MYKVKDFSCLQYFSTFNSFKYFSASVNSIKRGVLKAKYNNFDVKYNNFDVKYNNFDVKYNNFDVKYNNFDVKYNNFDVLLYF